MTLLSFRALGTAALALLTSVALTACSDAPRNTGDSGTTGASEFIACAISGSGGWDDNSFNQQVYEGLQEAESELGVRTIAFESQTSDNFAPGLESLVNEGCSLIFSVGFDANETANETAAANPDVNIVSIDGFVTDEELPNFKPVNYAMNQSSYLAGYLAAAQSRTHVIATFGAVQTDAITPFLDGYFYGAQAWSNDNDVQTTVTGWNAKTQTGSFVGDFVNQVQAKTISQNQIDQGADVLFPVAGPLFVAAAEAIRDSGNNAALVGVDSDISVTAPEYADITLTSVEKRMKNAVFTIIDDARAGDFDSIPYVGTLENGGTGLAPFGASESKISAETQKKLTKLERGIIGGSVNYGD